MRGLLAVLLLGTLASAFDVPVSKETRWCDWAAAVLAASRQDLVFEAQAPVEQRDKQIAAMRAKLAE